MNDGAVNDVTPEPVADAPAYEKPTPIQLFWIFLLITLKCFGAALPWVHRDLVERRRWLTEREFLEMFGLCQVLPGGNAVNLSIMVGTRFHGWVGALAAFLGMLGPPLVIGIASALLYSRFGTVAWVHGALGGMASAGAGLILATALKLAKPFRNSPPDLAFAVAAFAGIIIFKLPLVLVLLGLIAIAIAIGYYTWRRQRRTA